MWDEKYNEELYHYGVVGMKWGVRRKGFRSDVKAARLKRKQDAIKSKKAYEMSVDAARKKYGMSSGRGAKAVKTGLKVTGATVATTAAVAALYPAVKLSWGILDALS